MINFYNLAEKARRDTTSVRPEDLDNPRLFVAFHQPFNERLIDACVLAKDAPRAIHNILFIAFPERLLAKAAHITKNTRMSEEPLFVSGAKSENGASDLLGQYEAMRDDCRFLHLSDTDTVSRLKNVLVCHGLSPIGDSIALLADLGRAYRAAWVTGLPISAMLTDISWMNSNRSIRQFSITPENITTGLRICLDKRKRLYDALGIDTQVHAIVPFERTRKINRRKLDLISQRYRELAASLWGKDILGKLDATAKRMICTPLEHLAASGPEIPESVRVLDQFAGALSSLEISLKPHLEILRVIAQQFSSFDSDIFRYFFAQYYAQQEYCGSSLKIAPVTEYNFDEPFGRLDPYFRAWGEGHSTVGELGDADSQQITPFLSAIYLPQYQIGDIRVLPYTPLSLDALKQECKDHEQIAKRLIMLDTVIEEVGDASSHLASTPLAQRNRLIADLVSFFAYLYHRNLQGNISEAADSHGLPSFKETLAQLRPNAVKYFDMEFRAKTSEDICPLWMTWLASIPIESSPQFQPTHIHILAMDDDDWNELQYRAAATLCAIAASMFKSLCD